MRAVLEHTMVGPGLASESTMGPLNMTRHNEIVVGLVEQARAAGAEVIELGSYVDGALGASKNYLLPSLVLNPAQPWDRHRRAIRPVASDHRLGQRDRRRRSEERHLVGLCSSEWSSDVGHGSTIAAQLRTGVTFYNGHNAPFVDERTPFGGLNQSGIGRELGREGLLAFTETQVVAIPAS